MSSTVYTSALEIVFPGCYRSKTPSEVFPETLLFRLQSQPKLCSHHGGIYHSRYHRAKHLCRLHVSFLGCHCCRHRCSGGKPEKV